MALVSINKAAQLAGVSRQHLYKMAADGKISVDKSLLPGRSGNSAKDYRQLIDTSELYRVFGQLQKSVIDDQTGDADKKIEELEFNVAELKKVISDREAQLHQAQMREEWLRRQIDESQNIVKLLTYNREEAKGGSIDLIPIAEYNAMVLRARQKVAQLKEQNKILKNNGFFSWLFNR
jgi:hypothetical protein